MVNKYPPTGVELSGTVAIDLRCATASELRRAVEWLDAIGVSDEQILDECTVSITRFGQASVIECGDHIDFSENNLDFLIEGHGH